jgi:Zn-dependent protease
LGFGVNERFLLAVAQAGITWNLVLLVFNLFPLPPLDGGRILASLLPTRQSIAFGKLEPYGFFIVLALVFTGVIGSFWMEPLTAFFKSVVYFVTFPLQMIF